jgi:ribosomal protein L12E/L44/L45/RPP1/RPP2
MNPDDPGPFAFQDPERVKRILTAAGFKSVQLEPVDVQSDISNGKCMDEALVNAMEIGPASRALSGASADTRAKAEAALRSAFTPLQKDGKVLLGAGLWIVTAKNG